MKMALTKSLNMDNFYDGLAALIKGPSWVPGAPWRGHNENKQDVKIVLSTAVHNYTVLIICVTL